MTIGHVLKQAADRWPESTALVAGRTRLTYRELTDLVARFANGIRARGVEVGDAVALFPSNSVEQVVSYLAIQSVGAVAVPVNPRLSGGELATIVTDAAATAVICDEDGVGVVNRAAEDLPTVDRFVAAGGTERLDAIGSAVAEPFDSVVAEGSGEYPSPPVDLDAPALMMHTSGTTGRPKLVVIDHRGQLLNSLACIGELGYTHRDTALHVAPLSHSAGYLNLLLPCLQLGATQVLEPTFEPERTLERIESEGVTVMLGVPAHFQTLRSADSTAVDTSSLRLLVTSGAPLHQSTVDWVTEHLCETFVNVYGLTETTGLVTVARDVRDDESGFRIGEPFLTTEVRLVEVGDGVPPDETVDDGERGELVVRSPKVMREYYGRPAETAETLRDGWLYTGDVAVRRDGVYFLVDRVDNLIISGGENVYPREVESVLEGHPDVVDCAVVGTPDETLGEVVSAFVVSRDPDLSLDEVDSYWRERTDIADFKRPRELTLVDSIPRNQSGKIRREGLPDSG